jgi:heptosyltransferase-1
MFEGIQRILIVKLSSLGDVINAFPTAVALRERFPDAEIAWAVEPLAAPLVKAHRAIDRVFVLSISPTGLRPASYLRAFAKLARPLRRARFEVTLDLQGLLKSALLAWRSGARLRLGFSDDRREAATILNNVRVPPQGSLAVPRCLSMAAFMGADVSRPRAEVPVDPEAESWAAQLLAARAPLGATPVALCPGASVAINRWPAGRFIELGRLLAERGYLVPIIVGGPSEAALGQEIAAGIGPGAVTTAGETDLLRLASLLRRCGAMVAGDTGPMHLAAAVGTPVVALFGPADPTRTGPYGDGHIVIRKPFPCGPCLRSPTCGGIDCMRAISAAEVAEAVAGLLVPARAPAEAWR